MSNLTNFINIDSTSSRNNHIILGQVSGSVDLDLSQYNIFELEITGSASIQFTNLPSAELVNGWIAVKGNPDQDVTWDSSIVLNDPSTLPTSGTTLIQYQQINSNTIAFYPFKSFGVVQEVVLTGTATTLASKPGDAIGRASATVSSNGIIYVHGGITSIDNGISDFWQYDITNDTWLQLDSSPAGTERYGSCSEIINNKVYIFGGRRNTTSLNDILVYDINLGTWSQLQPSEGPTERYFIDSTVIDDQMWIFGGRIGTENGDDIWKFDTINETWTEVIPNFNPIPARYAPITTYNGNLYTVGGQGSSSQLNDAWVYNSISNEWEQLSSMQDTKVLHNLETVGNRLYVYGGAFSGTFVDELLMYNVQDNQWTALTTSLTGSGRRGASTVVYDDHLYIFCGEGNSSLLNDNWVVNNN